MKRFFHHQQQERAFTLIELIASLAILSLMLIGLATMMSFVIKTWLGGINSVDNFTKARVVMSLMDRDIQTMVLRRDMAAFADQTNGAACAFYTGVQGQPGSDTRAISIVQYSLMQTPASAATSSYLQRLNYGMNYTSAGMTPSAGNTANLIQLTNNVVVAAPPETLSTGVIAFQWQFVDGTGTVLNPRYSTLSSTPPTTSTLPTLPTPFWFDFSNPTGSYNPRIVVISMVVLSNSAYRLASQTGNLQNVVNCFSSVNAPLTSTNPIYSQAWNAALSSPSPAFLALPAPIRDQGAIQVFERHIPLPINP
jgi:prepilin-type N-terminal cleavage/methylation domain-containing protein